MPTLPQHVRMYRPEGREPSGRRGYDARWRKFRAWFLASHPECCGCGKIATEVDHDIPLSQGGARFASSNCRAYCKSCHSKKTYAKDGAFGRDIEIR